MAGPTSAKTIWFPLESYNWALPVSWFTVDLVPGSSLKICSRRSSQVPKSGAHKSAKSGPILCTWFFHRAVWSTSCRLSGKSDRLRGILADLQVPAFLAHNNHALKPTSCGFTLTECSVRSGWIFLRPGHVGFGAFTNWLVPPALSSSRPNRLSPGQKRLHWCDRRDTTLRATA